MDNLRVYLESGEKKTFAGALEWPGWCRSGRDDDAALQALLETGPRYAAVLRLAQIEFQPPQSLEELQVVERLKGTATTDFGAPDIPPALDQEPLDDAGLARDQALLRACWQAFDQAVQAAQGKDLRTGPRGGGRNAEKMIEHVLGAESSISRELGGRPQRQTGRTCKRNCKTCARPYLLRWPMWR